MKNENAMFEFMASLGFTTKSEGRGWYNDELGLTVIEAMPKKEDVTRLMLTVIHHKREVLGELESIVRYHENREYISAILPTLDHETLTKFVAIIDESRE